MTTTPVHETLRLSQQQGWGRGLSEPLVAAAALAARAGDAVGAARLCGAAAAAAVETPTRPEVQLRSEADAAALAVLGDDGWRREWDYGHRLPLPYATASALAATRSPEDGDCVSRRAWGEASETSIVSQPISAGR